MFHPNDTPLDRGWVGRIDGDRVFHLAAQTIQTLFLNRGQARDHAEYALADVTLLVPVQTPPAVRLFEADGSFAFANPAAVVGPDTTVEAPAAVDALFRLVGVIGADRMIDGYSLLVELRAPSLPQPKDRDFGLVTGPVVVTPDEVDARVDGFDWEEARSLAAANTRVRPGDLLGSPPIATRSAASGVVEFDHPVIGTLRLTVA